MLAQQMPDTSAMQRLQRQWIAVAGVSLGAVAAGYGLLRWGWQPASATRWLVLTLGVAAYVLLLARRRLSENHRPGEAALLPSLGLANLVSLLRGLLLALLAGFLLSPRPEGWLAWLPGGIYGVAVLLDLADGFIARVTRQQTALGATLDLELDALGILVAPLLAVRYGQLPLWFLLVSAARYLFVLGVWLRRRWGLPVYDLPPSRARRSMAGLMMGFVCAALLPVFAPPATALAGAAVMTPFLAGFVQDWFTVCGRRIAGLAAAAAWLPVGLRIAVGAAVLSCSHEGVLCLPAPEPFSRFALLALVALLVLGVAGRVVATLLLIGTGLLLAGASLTLQSAVVIVGSGLIMMLGSGALSLWRPGSMFARRRYRSETHANIGEAG